MTREILSFLMEREARCINLFMPRFISFGQVFFKARGTDFAFYYSNDLFSIKSLICNRTKSTRKVVLMAAKRFLFHLSFFQLRKRQGMATLHHNILVRNPA